MALACHEKFADASSCEIESVSRTLEVNRLVEHCEQIDICADEQWPVEKAVRAEGHQILCMSERGDSMRTGRGC